MYGNEKPILIYTWKSNKLNQPDPKVLLKDMNSDKDNYNPEENVKNLAKLFCQSLPGNTLDIFYDSIATELMRLIDPNIEYADQQHISNIVRIIVNHLAEGE